MAEPRPSPDTCVPCPVCDDKGPHEDNGGRGRTLTLQCACGHLGEPAETSVRRKLRW